MHICWAMHWRLIPLLFTRDHHCRPTRTRECQLIHHHQHRSRGSLESSESINNIRDHIDGIANLANRRGSMCLSIMSRGSEGKLPDMWRGLYKWRRLTRGGCHRRFISCITIRIQYSFMSLNVYQEKWTSCYWMRYHISDSEANRGWSSQVK